MRGFLSALRARSLRQYVAKQKEAYGERSSDEAIAAWQLKAFNLRWHDIREHVPYFRGDAAGGQLPSKFDSWAAFDEHMPVMSRGFVQEHRSAFVDGRAPPDFYRITGGSTSQPIQLPAWASESVLSSHDMWHARSWYGVDPADPMFLIWGHRHLLGTGVRRVFNTAMRRFKDAALGYHRFSAYDISDARLLDAGAALLSHRPAYVMGYSSALDRFARINEARRAEFHALRLKLVVATSESFPRDDSARRVADLFGCRVAMEYGAIETGPLAYEHPSNGAYLTFWRNYRLDFAPSTVVPGAFEVRATALYDRCFPLIRYELSDLVVPLGDGAPGLRFKTIIGRSNDSLELSNGARVHPQAIRDAISWCSDIRDFQMVQSSSAGLQLAYVAGSDLNSTDLDRLRSQFIQVNPGFETLKITRVDALEQTVAGKTKRIVQLD